MTAARPSANGRRADPPRAPVDWTAVSYRPAEGTPLRRCSCGGAYVDDEPSRVAHVAVFGHSPRPAEPATTPREDPPR
jgi:hypothetical protein